MSKRFLLLVVFLLLISFSSFGQQPPQRPAPAAMQSVEDRTAGMKRLDGYIPMFWDERGGSMYLEISRFDSDFLFSTGLSAGLGSNDIGLDRGQGSGGKIVRFQR